ncbi:MAG: UDP-N-acetylmuramoyl-L-alanine--D-glutamate ligase [candidate division NC10 bacterium]|nr:UDP-N-acetylmuramoyl-L-alanine--D-glutamate ligase [candidate division NC10 bacterium]
MGILNLKGKRVTVVGLARSGFAASKLLVKLGAQVIASDRSPAEGIKVDMAYLQYLGVRLELGGHRPETFLEADLIVLSPGVDPRHPLLLKARTLGIPIWSEVELAFRASSARLIGVTGTNGKSTTVSLLGEILKEAGLQVVVAGNVGTALSEVIPELGPEVLVIAELSSFQLEGIHAFRPLMSLLLNLAPDHLDRYASLEDYYAAKVRIFENQGPTDYAILNADDPEVLKRAHGIKAQPFHFSRHHEVLQGCFLQGDLIFFSQGGVREGVASWKDVRIQGVHNLENALAAVAVARLAGAEAASIRKALGQFPGLEHRLEPVAEINGVSYINDSKGTNVGAVIKSLESFSSPIVLIAGGRDKGEDFTPLAPLVKERVKAAVLIGEAKEKLRRALDGTCPLFEAGSMAEAVALSSKLAQKGEIVLLSPACASFDMFADFEERGRAFKKAVLELRV